MTRRPSQGHPDARHGAIDLHLHTTASDGRCTPRVLVDLAAAAGLFVMAVTDHDTTAAVADAQAYGEERGIDVIPGIEITAVGDGRDVHVLGYFLNAADATLERFLSSQRENRLARVAAIGERLATLGMPISIDAVLAEARQLAGRSIGRPQVARALVAAGYVANTSEAFDRWLGQDCPAFVPRTGPAIDAVIAIIHSAGGLASLAHPGRTAIDHHIPAIRDAGLDALEAYHSDHDPELVDRYEKLAGELGLLLTGGSDFHGDPGHGASPGSVTLPRIEWDRLCHARERHG